MKKVLIALDYNPTAQKVAEVGFSMAKSMNAEVILLHVITDPVFYSTSGYSPIMGYNGYEDMSPIQLESVDGLKNASFNIWINRENISEINLFKPLLKKVILLMLFWRLQKK